MAAHIACDMVHPCEVDVKATVTALECHHLDSELKAKALQYVKDVGTLDRQCYITVPLYL